MGSFSYETPKVSKESYGWLLNLLMNYVVKLEDKVSLLLLSASTYLKKHLNACISF